MAKKNPDLEYKYHAPVYGPKKEGPSLTDILGGIALAFIGLLVLGQCAG